MYSYNRTYTDWTRLDGEPVPACTVEKEKHVNVK